MQLMARYAKVTVLPQAQLRYPLWEEYPNKKADPEALLQMMLPHLQKNLEEAMLDKPDLIVLPEVCDRFSMMPIDERHRYYRYRGDKILDFYREQAIKNHCYIAYSACRCVPEDTKYPFRNSTQIIGRNGEVVGIYDKNHLVPAELDEGLMGYGTEAPVFELDFGRVGCAICFDLNYDELLMRYAAQKPELMIFSSMYPGGVVQEKWAVTCRSYFAASVCNKDCRILNPMGQLLNHTPEFTYHATQRINLDYAMLHLDHNHAFAPSEGKLYAAKRKYGDKLVIHANDNLGYTMITYEDTDRTAMDIVREFDMILLDDYFNNCRAHRNAHIAQP